MSKNNHCTGRNWTGLETLEQRQLLAVDLGLVIGDLPANIPTGNTIKVPVSITNNTAGAISGSATFQVQLDDSSGGGFVTLATVTQSGTIAAGQTVDITISALVPAGALPGDDTLRVVMTPPQGLTASTPSTDANVVWQFGQVAGFGSNVVLKAVDPHTGQTGTFSIKGPGAGTLVNGGNDNLWDMTLADTTGASAVTVLGAVSLEAVTANSMVGKFIAAQADFDAYVDAESSSVMDFRGGLLSLQMHDATATSGDDYHELRVGNSDSAKDVLSLTFNNANDLNVDSNMPIGSFTAASVLSNGSDPNISTNAWIGKIAIAGDFGSDNGGAEFDATTANPKTGFGIGSVSVGGDFVSSWFYSEVGNIGQVTIGGDAIDSTIEAEYGSISGVKVAGGMSGSKIETYYGNIGPVVVGGDFDNSSQVYISDIGNIKSLAIGGNMDHSSYVYISDYGIIGPVTIKGNMQNSAYIEGGDHGDLLGVTIGGNLDNSAYIECDDGNLLKATVGGNVDNEAYFDIDGDIVSLSIGGNLDHDAYIEAAEGSIGKVAIKGNVDNSAEIYASNGPGGIGSVQIGGNLANGAQIYADQASIGKVAIGGAISGTSNSKVSIYAQNRIGSLTVAKDAEYLDFHSHSSIGSVGIGGALRNSLVSNYGAGPIDAIKCALLDGSTILAGAGENTNGDRSDFSGLSSIGKLTISGVTAVGAKARGVKAAAAPVNYMINGSEIRVWDIGKMSFAKPSDGDGLIEWHTGSVANAPNGVTMTQVA